MDRNGKIGGRIASYGLQDWWLSTFTQDEREYIDSQYQPMGVGPHSLTQGPIHEKGEDVTKFLNGLNTWFRASKDSGIAERIHAKLIELAKEHPVSGPGYFNGRHFTTYVRDIEHLKRNGEYLELEKLLLELVGATETEDAVRDWGVAPFYYEELAILYRKQKGYPKEVSILERFARHKHGPGVKPAKLLERLNTARELAAKG